MQLVFFSFLSNQGLPDLSIPPRCFFSPIFSFYDPMAVIAYAKGAVVYIAMLQELFFLGSPKAKETVIGLFAGRAADWLQARVSFLTNINTTLLTVMDASSLDGGENGKDPLIIRCGLS